MFGIDFILKCLQLQEIARWEPKEKDILNEALFECALKSN